MNKHTPGPWEFCTRLQPSENHRGYYIKSKKFVVAFEVIPVDQDGKEGEANARLMAAAPELLEALRVYDSWNYEVQSARVNGESIYSFAELCELRERAVAMGYAAINKATGAA